MEKGVSGVVNTGVGARPNPGECRGENSGHRGPNHRNKISEPHQPDSREHIGDYIKCSLDKREHFA